MEQNIKINYTEAAKQKIDELNKKYIQDLEYFLKETKYVPGEDFIEVTASDINELAKYIKIIYPRTKVFEIRNFVLKTYFVLGILTIFCGLFYSEIQNIILYRPIQAVITLTGVITTVVAFLILQSFKRKEVRMEEDELRREIVLSKFCDLKKIEPIEFGEEFHDKEFHIKELKKKLGLEDKKML